MRAYIALLLPMLVPSMMLLLMILPSMNLLLCLKQGIASPCFNCFGCTDAAAMDAVAATAADDDIAADAVIK